MSGYRVTEMYAFLAVGDDGEEGVPSFYACGMMLPLVAADAARVESLRAMARQVVAKSGRPVTLARFTVREDVETIGG